MKLVIRRLIFMNFSRSSIIAISRLGLIWLANSLISLVLILKEALTHDCNSYIMSIQSSKTWSFRHLYRINYTFFVCSINSSMPSFSFSSFFSTLVIFVLSELSNVKNYQTNSFIYQYSHRFYIQVYSVRLTKLKLNQTGGMKLIWIIWYYMKRFTAIDYPKIFCCQKPFPSLLHFLL